MKNHSEHILPFDFKMDYPIITNGKGIYLYDINGKEYIDGTSGSISSSLGHGREDVGEVLKSQASSLAFINRHVASSEILSRAANKLHEITGMDRFFTVSGGTEANEISTKIARLHFYHKGMPEKNMIIGRWQSYHGYSVDTLSYGGNIGRRKEFETYLRQDNHIAPPYCYRCWFGKSEERCDFECANALEAEILRVGPDKVAGFIFETVCGTSLNAAVAPAGYYKRIREICDKYDVLLILDEIMCGAGRTGKMLAIDYFGVKADIVSLAKSIGGGYFPLGIACCTEEVIEPIKKFGSFSPGHTWAGNPLAAAIILKVLEVVKGEDLLKNVQIQGKLLKKLLGELATKHPSIGNIQGLGLMVGVEFVKDKTTKQCFEPQDCFSERLERVAREKGLLLMGTKNFYKGETGDGIMIGPCFEITSDEIIKLVNIFDDALTVVEKEMKVI